MKLPETRFATVGEDRIAYQVLGSGPFDLVFTSGQISHVDLDWEDPLLSRFLRRLASFSRLIVFNSRGSGLSDPRPQDGRKPCEHWNDELLAVMTAIQSETVAIVGWNDAGPLVLPFAARNPEKVSRLVLINTTARYSRTDGYPEGHAVEVVQQFINFAQKYWGTEKWALKVTPELAEDPAALRNAARMYRAIASPKAFAQIISTHLTLDARDALPNVKAPTLVMTRRDYPWVPVSHGRYIAERVPGARFIELPGSSATPYSDTSELVLDHIEEFLTGRCHSEESAGDGILSTFKRPDNALRCAKALILALAELGLQLKAGIHFGDIEQRENGHVSGVTVHIGARIASFAAPAEVLVSRTVRDILLGSPFHFEELGLHELRGIDETWMLYKAH